ncbi:MAG: ketoacyl-ACP synthase III [Bacteroidota bacterium]
MKYGSCIESVGVSIPDQVLSTRDLVKKLALSKPLKLELMTGIRERRISEPEEDSLVLAEKATLDCLKYSKYDAGEIEMIIYCAITKYVDGLKHLYEPAVSLLLKKSLACEDAISFDITNACAGMLSGFHIASNFIERGVVKNCLVVSGEYITSLSRNAIENISTADDPQVASLTLGDAGGAAMLSRSVPEEGISSSKFVTFGNYSDLCIAYLSPHQSGGIMKTRMKEIHEASISHAPKVIEEALDEAGLSMDQIDLIIPHQTSRHAIKAGHVHFSKYFRKFEAKVLVNLSRMGNTASTSHVLALYRFLKEGKIKRGDRIMLLSFASGLVIGVVIFVINDLAENYGSSH